MCGFARAGKRGGRAVRRPGQGVGRQLPRGEARSCAADSHALPAHSCHHPAAPGARPQRAAREHGPPAQQDAGDHPPGDQCRRGLRKRRGREALEPAAEPPVLPEDHVRPQPERAVPALPHVCKVAPHPDGRRLRSAFWGGGAVASRGRPSGDDRRSRDRRGRRQGPDGEAGRGLLAHEKRGRSDGDGRRSKRGRRRPSFEHVRSRPSAPDLAANDCRGVPLDSGDALACATAVGGADELRGQRHRRMAGPNTCHAGKRLRRRHRRRHRCCTKGQPADW
mmetsp:Transcript_8084/g.30370  ORF Transcript_8084/g.30370 Transcript_8084/m.30370 type:complete len:279 (+) Transcript_8084:424-1260(+)